MSPIEELKERLAAQIDVDAAQIVLPEDSAELKRIIDLVVAAENTDVNLAVDKSDGTLYWHSPSDTVEESEDGFVIRLTADEPEPEPEPSGKYVRTPDGWDK